MKTPAGFECPYFFGDYFRGRSQEECRLIGKRSRPQNWTPDLCKSCPVPAISRDNSCEHMILKAEVVNSLFGIIRKVKVSAYCNHSQSVVADPHIGCGQCHPLPFEFVERK
jgi:hypothetical protein